GRGAGVAGRRGPGSGNRSGLRGVPSPAESPRPPRRHAHSGGLPVGRRRGRRLLRRPSRPDELTAYRERAGRSPGGRSAFGSGAGDARRSPCAGLTLRPRGHNVLSAPQGSGTPEGGRPVGKPPSTEQTRFRRVRRSAASEKADFDNRAGSDEMASPPGRRRASGIGTALPEKLEIDIPSGSGRVKNESPRGRGPCERVSARWVSVS